MEKEIEKVNEMKLKDPLQFQRKNNNFQNLTENKIKIKVCIRNIQFMQSGRGLKWKFKHTMREQRSDQNINYSNVLSTF